MNIFDEIKNIDKYIENLKEEECENILLEKASAFGIGFAPIHFDKILPGIMGLDSDFNSIPDIVQGYLQKHNLL